MKFPTMDEFAQMVADKAIDEVEYNGKTLRQWIDIISASEHSTNLAEVGTDCISRQAAIDAIGEKSDEIYKTKQKGATYPHDDFFQGMAYAEDVVKRLPSAQPERTCVNCGRTANNGGWYADGRTRCPIEEHYALPKNGYCHLWEKRNVTDDDYPERREE